MICQVVGLPRSVVFLTPRFAYPQIHGFFNLIIQVNPKRLKAVLLAFM
jgi:hypothetical protein